MSQPLDATVRRGQEVAKVTTFVLDRRAGVDALLLLYHPHAGVQLPAGTVEVGEDLQAAALREAQEETGLAGLVWGGWLGEERDELPATTGMMAQTAPVYTRPQDPEHSHTMATLRRGLLVEVMRGMDGFLQVHYAESDRYPQAQYVSFALTGWVAAEAVAASRVRHFAWVSAPSDTPDEWSNWDDQHNFTLRWHPLDELPEVVPTQAAWLRYLESRVDQR